MTQWMPSSLSPGEAPDPSAPTAREPIHTSGRRSRAWEREQLDESGPCTVRAPACLPARPGSREGLPVGPAPLTTFLALTLRVRQMRSRMSCTGTVTGAPNSELDRIEQGAPQRGVPSAALCLPPHSLTHLSMSPRQRASPENLCRSRRRVWASASSEADSNVSAPGLSYCMGAGQTHSHVYLPAPPPFRWRTHPYSTYCLLPRNQQPPLSGPVPWSPHPTPGAPSPLAPERQPGPTCLCALIQAPEQAVQRGQQAAQLLLPAVRVLQALGEAGPQRRQPGVTLAGQLPERGRTQSGGNQPRRGSQPHQRPGRWRSEHSEERWNGRRGRKTQMETGRQKALLVCTAR